jgi:hypothetical protein
MKDDWISVTDSLPRVFSKDSKETSCYVLVTDGELVEIAFYVFEPRNYGCAVDDDEEEATCGPQPHWHFDDGGCFRDGDRCFGRIETHKVTHWQYLPEPK